jgi:hypothetical protein
MLTTLLFITSINGTIIAIIAINFYWNTTNHGNTRDGMACIGNYAIIAAVSTTSLSITTVHGARIAIITFNGYMRTSSYAVTSIFSTSIIIIAANGASLTT